MCRVIDYDGFCVKLPDRNTPYRPGDDVQIEDERLPHLQKGKHIYITAMIWSTDDNEEKIVLDPDEYHIPEMIPNDVKIDDIKCLTFEQYSENRAKIELERDRRQTLKLQKSRSAYLAKRYQEATNL